MICNFFSVRFNGKRTENGRKVTDSALFKLDHVINKDERSANHCNLLVGQMMMMNILKVLKHLKQASPVVSLQGESLLPGSCED
jgi:hypothetical protein